MQDLTVAIYHVAANNGNVHATIRITAPQVRYRVEGKDAGTTQNDPQHYGSNAFDTNTFPSTTAYVDVGGNPSPLPLTITYTIGCSAGSFTNLPPYAAFDSGSEAYPALAAADWDLLTQTTDLSQGSRSLQVVSYSLNYGS
jgi:hypothetical protein